MSRWRECPQTRQNQGVRCLLGLAGPFLISGLECTGGMRRGCRPHAHHHLTVSPRGEIDISCGRESFVANAISGIAIGFAPRIFAGYRMAPGTRRVQIAVSCGGERALEFSGGGVMMILSLGSDRPTGRALGGATRRQGRAGGASPGRVAMLYDVGNEHALFHATNIFQRPFLKGRSDSMATGR